MFKDKKIGLFIVLAGIFITNALLAEIIGSKLFSAEATLGIAPIDIKIFGEVYNFNLTAGVTLWPVVFITTDIINEYFGKPGVRRLSLLTVALISYAFVAIYLVTELPPAQVWLELNATDVEGNPFNIDFAFNKVYLQSMGIIVASLLAFLIGQFLDAYVFHKLRSITGSDKIWLRATGSTLVSQLVDSFVVLFVAFYLLGNWSLTLVLSVGAINYMYKFLVAVLITPLLYVAHAFIDRYLGKSAVRDMTEKASADSRSFF